MTPRHPTSLIAESILADSAPRTFPGRTSNHDTPPAPAAPPQEPAAKEVNEFLRPADPDMGWVDQVVRDAEDAAVQSRRRPLYREGLLTPERRPVVRCAECDLEREPDERDCPRCGSERALQEAGR